MHASCKLEASQCSKHVCGFQSKLLLVQLQLATVGRTWPLYGPVVSIQALANLHSNIPCAKQQGWQCLVKWLMYLQLLQMLKTRCRPCFVSSKCVGEIQLLPLGGTLKEPGVNWLKKSFANWCHGSILDCGRSRQQYTPLSGCWILAPAFG